MTRHTSPMWLAILASFVAGALMYALVLFAANWLYDWNYHHIVYWSYGLPHVITVTIHPPQFIVIDHEPEQGWTITNNSTDNVDTTIKGIAK